MNVGNTIITVWDTEGEPSQQQGLAYTWTGYAERDKVRSILQYVEAHADRLRSRYLAWIHDIGESRVGNKRIVEHFGLGKDFSYWWMTLLAERSPWKSPSIIDVIRVFALEEIILEARPNKVILVGLNPALNETLKELCENLSIGFEYRCTTGKQAALLSAAGWYRKLPWSLRGIILFVRHLIARWSLRDEGKSSWIPSDRAVFFCSYFLHFDANSCARGDFRSHYWGDLPRVLREESRPINWLHHYLESAAVATPSLARECLRECNRRQAETQTHHAFLDSYLSPGIIWKVLRGWFHLLNIGCRIGKRSQMFRPRGSNCSFWPLIRNDWYESLHGPIAVLNLFYFELFDKVLGELSKQSIGLYLHENQGWEQALVHAWRKHGHGRLIGVAHSTVRFWDLRYFFDPRTIKSTESYSVQKADAIAFNGRAALSAFGTDYPQENFVECEALRYDYLNNRGHDATSETSTQRRVLILTDYAQASTSSMLKLLEAAVLRCRTQAIYAVKPHPNCSVDVTDYPSLDLQVTNGALSEVLCDFDVAYCSNITSAALDAYLFGLPVIVMLENAELNFSPLRGCSDVRFVADAAQLALALDDRSQIVIDKTSHQDLFFMDPKLPRWRRLLKLSELA